MEFLGANSPLVRGLSNTQYLKPLQRGLFSVWRLMLALHDEVAFGNVDFDSKGRTTSLSPTRSSARHLHLTQSSSSGSKNPINPINPTLHLSGLVWFYY